MTAIMASKRGVEAQSGGDEKRRRVEDEKLLESDGEEDEVMEELVEKTAERKTEDKKHYVRNAWKKESSLPDGWLMRKTDSKEYFIISSTGKQFNGRRAALVEMVRNGVEEQALAAFRKTMVDWQMSDLLPAGWMYRYERKDYWKDTSKMLFMASSGELLKYFLGAIKFMEKSYLYSELDITKLNQLKQKLSRDHKMSCLETSPGVVATLVLPEGWRSRMCGNKEYVVCPNGGQFVTPRLALVEMVRRGLPEHQLISFKESMPGWQMSDLLPKGWLYKYERNNFETKQNHLKIHFLSSTGNLLKSFLSAIKFMETSLFYKEEDIDRLNLFLKQITASWRINKMEDKSSSLVLPEGWKSRICGSKEYVVSPEGNQFNNERLALVEMVKRGLPETDLDNMRDSMAGWKRNDYLPAGWRFKHERKNYVTRKDHSKINFVASTGELLKSAQSALKFIKESHQYNEGDACRLNLFSKQIIAEWRKTHVTSSSSSLVLPEGWKSRVCGSREYVVSPEGDQFDGGRLALVEMVKRGLPESDLNNLRDSMSGWESSELLPKGWRAKTGRKCEFLSHSGERVQGRLQALELIQGMGPEEMTNFEKYSKQLTVQTRE